MYSIIFYSLRCGDFDLKNNLIFDLKAFFSKQKVPRLNQHYYVFSFRSKMLENSYLVITGKLHAIVHHQTDLFMISKKACKQRQGKYRELQLELSIITTLYAYITLHDGKLIFFFLQKITSNKNDN